MIENLHIAPLQNTRITHHFGRILSIPRPSGQEESVRNYVTHFAEKHGFVWRRDQKGNLAFDIPAKPGCQEMPRILIQNHLDMVPYGGNDAKPTVAYIDTDGWMKAKSTTLGADNGLGIAMALALAEEDFCHGPLTLLFTVEEETGLKGAQELGPDIIPLDTTMMINLDSEEGVGYICKGSAGGMDIEARLEIPEKNTLPVHSKILEINLSGLKGGHSGVDIHEEHGNAIVLMNELLWQIREAIGEFALLEYSGGTVRNAIARDARALIAVPENAATAVMDLVQRFHHKIQNEDISDLHLTSENAEHLIMTCTGIEKNDAQIIPGETVQKLLQTLRDLPFGPLKTVPEKSTKVLLSNNIGTLEMSADAFTIGMFPRFAQKDDFRELQKTICTILEENNALVTQGIEAPAWEEPHDSPAVALAAQAMQTVTGEEPLIFSYHAGLECSVIVEKLRAYGAQNVSAVSIGPLVKDNHGPEEKAEMQSIDAVYEVLKVMVAGGRK